MKKIFHLIMNFLQKKIYSYSTHEWIEKKLSFFRSYWLHGAFARCHSSVRFGKIGWIHGSEHIAIDHSTAFGDNFYLTSWPEHTDTPKDTMIEIGSSCYFAQLVHITAANYIRIGNNVLTGKSVTISDNNHGDTNINTLMQKPSERAIVSKGPVIIEDDVWIGDKATILSGVTIGKGAVIAANAVITKDVPAYSVAAGNPAKIIRNARNEN